MLLTKTAALSTKKLTKAALQVLQQAPWPGNVRQLENTCRWLTVMAPTQLVDRGDLPPDLLAETGHEKDDNSAQWITLLRHELQQRCAAGDTEILAELVPTIERIALEVALAHTNGHKQKTAALLGWGRNTVTRKLNEMK